MSRHAAPATLERLEGRQLLVADTAVFASADFNGDVFEDIVILTGRTGAQGQKGKPRLIISLGNGDGTYGAPETITFSRPGSITSVATGDFNGDTTNDLLVSSNGKLKGLTDGQRNKRTRVHLVLGNGDGTFGKPTAVQLGGIQEARYISTANVDNDGHLDLLVASKQEPNFDAKKGGDGIFLLLGNGDGTFQDAQLIAEL